jgi:microcin C transport system substrate-binding protein
MRDSLLRAFLVVATIAAFACGGGTSNQQQPQASNSGAPAANRANVSMNKADYAVFPNADAGADPSVSAEQGGKGFKGDGWQTNTDFDLIGDPRAIKGGVLRDTMADFPGTLRPFDFGPEATGYINYFMTPLVYETLLTLHPTTVDYMPALATHWQISPDHMTFRFRINPNARFSDGQPVTAEDVVATWSFVMDKGLQSESMALVYGKLEKPVAESKYIVRVKSKQLNWRNFLYFSQALPILPAHILKDVDGARFLKDYNFKLLPGSGPYAIADSDVVKGKTVTIRRRKDYWAEKQRRNIGLYNFDEFRETVIRDPNLVFETFKRGDLDYYFVNSSRRWIEEMNFDKVQHGLIQKRKIFNEAPQGFGGLAMNTRKSPFNDLRVRKALALLLNRPLLIEKLFFKQYVPMNSYYPAGPYENPNNPKNDYDPQAAIKLLTEAGYTARDAQGRLVKDGKPLVFDLINTDKGSEPWLTVYQEDLRKVGIGMNLRLVTPETQFKLAMERQFDAVYQAWGSEGTTPNPETSFHSRMADVNNTNNITGFKDPRVDQLLDAYDKEFDQKKRIAIVREIDGIVANSYQYVLVWTAPFQRLAYWNKFGHPDKYLSRIGDYSDIFIQWWIDPTLDNRLSQALRDASISMPVGTTEDHFWQEYGKQHPLGTGDAAATH